MKSLGLHAYLKIAKSRKNLVIRKGHSPEGTVSPILLYTGIAENDPSLFRPLYSWESTTRPSTLIDTVLVRWLRIYKPRITVRKYNEIAMSLANEYSGNASSVYKAISVSDRDKKPVFAMRYNESFPWMAATNLKKRGIYGARERLKQRQARAQEIKDKYFKCDLCKASMLKDDYYTSMVRRKHLEINGSALKAENYMRKHLSLNCPHFCQHCHVKMRKRLAVIDESEAIREDIRAIKRAIKKQSNFTEVSLNSKQEENHEL